jgi:hypothetical protein
MGVRFRFILTGLIFGVLAGCSSVRRVTPLEPGTSAVTVSLGGPLTEIAEDVSIPLPLLGAGYNYGISDKLGVEGGVNITAALFGLLHLDAGVNWFPLTCRGGIPGITVTPKIFLMSDFDEKGTRLYPTVTPVVYWKPGRHIAYLGVENWFETARVRSDGNTQQHHWLVAPCVGYGISWKKWQFQIEGRGYTPNLKNTGRATKNIGFGEYGIIGIFLGVNRSIGGAQ